MKNFNQLAKKRILKMFLSSVKTKVAMKFHKKLFPAERVNGIPTSSCYLLQIQSCEYLSLSMLLRENLTALPSGLASTDEMVS